MGRLVRNEAHSVHQNLSVQSLQDDEVTLAGDL